MGFSFASGLPFDLLAIDLVHEGGEQGDSSQRQSGLGGMFCGDQGKYVLYVHTCFACLTRYLTHTGALHERPLADAPRCVTIPSPNAMLVRADTVPGHPLLTLKSG